MPSSLSSPFAVGFMDQLISKELRLVQVSAVFLNVPSVGTQNRPACPPAVVRTRFVHQFIHPHEWEDVLGII